MSREKIFGRPWRFMTIMLAALSMGMGLCHLLEMPARLAYDPDLWLRVTLIEGTYRYFSPPLGALVEAAAVVASGILAVLVRQRGRVFPPALAGFGFILTAHLMWWLIVFPVNEQLSAWYPVLPANFKRLREIWEYANAVRAVLQIAGLAAIVHSVLLELPAEPSRKP
jgi:hypothetical protein